MPWFGYPHAVTSRNAIGWLCKEGSEVDQSAALECNLHAMTLHLALAAIVLAGNSQVGPTTKPGDAIGKPPEKLGHDGFYTKHATFKGLPILASKNVDDKALHKLVYGIGRMLEKVPEAWIEAFVASGSLFAIIGKNEGQTDLPQYRHLKNDPNTDWDKRARGLGGRTTSAGEENILELDGDRYRGESIWLHEFAHTLSSQMFARVDPEHRRELRAAYDKAMAAGLWKNTYAATNSAEYWAEGVQCYFDTNRSASPPDGVHNEICNREQLKEYDPALFELIERSFGGNPWRYEGKYNTSRKQG